MTTCSASAHAVEICLYLFYGKLVMALTLKVKKMIGLRIRLQAKPQGEKLSLYLCARTNRTLLTLITRNILRSNNAQRNAYILIILNISVCSVSLYFY